MDYPRQFDPGREQDFHNNAVRCFVDGEPSLPGDMANFGVNLLRSFPFKNLAITLVDLQTNQDPALQELSFFRKVLMVGRDTVNLTNKTDLIDYPKASPIIQLTMLLVRIADDVMDKGRIKPKHIKKAAGLCVESAIATQTGIGKTFIEPISTSSLAKRCKQSMGSEILLNPRHQAGEDSYHTARRGFRAVFHLGIASHIVSASPDKLDYLQQGVELSKIYGKRHRSINKALTT